VCSGPSSTSTKSGTTRQADAEALARIYSPSEKAKSETILNGDRVHNGKEETTPGGTVFVQSKKQNGRLSNCTGSLIAPNWVLTAGHCLYDRSTGKPAKSVTISYGSVKKNGGTKIRGTGYCHSEYGHEGKGFINDIALIRLSKPAAQAKLMPLISSSQKSLRSRPARTSITAFGFGQKEKGTPSRVLYSGAMRSADKGQACLGPYHTKSMVFCSGTNASQGKAASVCHGDSGGPVVFAKNGARYQVGINSYIYNTESQNDTYCGKSGNFAAFVEVHSYLNWINTVMKAIP
jgi:secreted trypsin-like serine protease